MGSRPAIVGREAELAVLARLATGSEGLRAVVIDGAPGIGKTTLWRAGTELATSVGTVLRAQPAETEQGLPFAALGDLLDPLAAPVDSLPPRQRDALRAALQLAGGATAIDRLAVSRATLAVVRAAADDRPLFLCVDDVQWLDEPSEEVLRFVLRRVTSDDVRVLLARRTTGATTSAPLGIDRVLEGAVALLEPGPLALVDMDRLLRERVGLVLPRPRLVDVHRLVGGVPLYALEVGRALAGREPADELSLPSSLNELVAGRIEALPADARDTALLAAASAHPRAETVELAAGGSAGLRAAVALDVLALDGERVRFVHPLFASAAYAAATPGERRDAHARLAAVTKGAERARHLGRSATEPAEDVAAEIEAAARDLASRGSHDAAAELAIAAVRLTPAGSPATVDRAVLAARYRLAAGDPESARADLERVVSRLPPGRERAGVLAQLADMHGSVDTTRSKALYARARAEADGDDTLEATVDLGLQAILWNEGDMAGAAAAVRRAAAAATRAGDDALLAMALAELITCDAYLGRPLDTALVERALALESRIGDEGLSSYSRPSLQVGIVYTALNRLDEARGVLDGELRRAERSGDDAIAWHLHTRLSEVELRAGRYAAALDHARTGLAQVRLLAYPALEPFALVPLASVLAHVGDLDRADEAGRRALVAAEESGADLVAWRARGALGLAALSRQDAGAAWELLAPALDGIAARRPGELSVFGTYPSAIEALVELDRLDEAEQLSRYVEEKGVPGWTAWHRTVGSRGRALAASARGAHETAEQAIAHALEAAGRLTQPFEVARTLLAKGRIDRRAKRRNDARVALVDALARFDELGAARWAEQAAADLGRLPGRPRAVHDGLTPTERQVAELVAQGLSNKEVAARLFVTVRTVEANLTRVYAKLGLRSRTELARRLAR